MAQLAEKAQRFLRLHHEPPILILPNVWDVGSAKLMTAEGFPAIATSSSAISFTFGRADGQQVERGQMLEVVERIATSVEVPVTADLEAGYGATPETVAETILLAIAVGAVGANLEDTDHAHGGLLEREEAADRIRAGCESAKAAGVPFVLNARADSFLQRTNGGPDEWLRDAIERANSYREAGAECLFVPGVSDASTIAELVREIDGPLNILAGPKVPPAPELERLGVARVSVGGSLARRSLGMLQQVAAELRGSGTFSFTDGIPSNAEIGKLMAGKT